MFRPNPPPLGRTIPSIPEPSTKIPTVARWARADRLARRIRPKGRHSPTGHLNIAAELAARHAGRYREAHRAFPFLGLAHSPGPGAFRRRATVPRDCRNHSHRGRFGAPPMRFHAAVPRRGRDRGALRQDRSGSVLSLRTQPGPPGRRFFAPPRSLSAGGAPRFSRCGIRQSRSAGSGALGSRTFASSGSFYRQHGVI